MSKIRQILMAANAAADYSKPELRSQVEDLDLDSLERDVARIVHRAVICAHAVDCMRDGTHEHPMQAFLHAIDCPALEIGPVSDDEFAALFTIWARLCEKSQRANTAQPADSVDQSRVFMDRFMRSE